MKYLRGTAILLYVLISGVSVRASECSNANAIDESKCSVVKCPDTFRNLVGVWQGRERVELNEDTLTSDVQLIFADRACLSRADEVADILIGRQTAIIPSGKNNGPKTAYKSIVISEKDDAIKDSAGDENRLYYKRTDLSLSEAKNKTVLKMPGRNIEFQKLSIGQVSFFAGKAWTMTDEGNLVAVANFLMKSDYDPSTNTVEEKLIYDNGKGKNPSHNLVVDVFDVMTESNSGSRTDRHLVNRNLDKSHKVADLLVDGKIYREERVALDNNSNRILIFKSGDQISSSEFRRRIGEQLKKQRSSLRSPASKKQP